MKKFIFVFCLLISLTSCTYKRNMTIDVSYGIHYPDTTVIYSERYKISVEFFSDKGKYLTADDFKPEIYSYEGTNMITVPHYRTIGPRTTAPIHIISSKVYLED